MQVWRYPFKIIPFVKTFPMPGKKAGGDIGGILHIYHRILLRRMAVEISAHQIAIPLPVIFGVGSGMYAHKTPARFDILDERFLLLVVEHIMRSAQEDHRG